jgi:hypothetical protein
MRLKITLLERVFQVVGIWTTLYPCTFVRKLDRSRACELLTHAFLHSSAREAHAAPCKSELGLFFYVEGRFYFVLCHLVTCFLKRCKCQGKSISFSLLRANAAQTFAQNNYLAAAAAAAAATAADTKSVEEELKTSDCEPFSHFLKRPNNPAECATHYSFERFI